MKRLVFVMAGLLLGCPPAQTPQTPQKRPAAIAVEPQVTTLELNGQSVLRATLKDADGAVLSDPAVKIAWMSSAPAISTVDDTGKLTGVGPGSATITAAVPGGPSAQVLINVSPAPAAVAPPAATPGRPALARLSARQAAKAPPPPAAKATGFRINTTPGKAEFKLLP